MDARAQYLKKLRKAERERKKNLESGIHQAVNAMMVIPCYALADKFDFTTEQLEDYLKEFERLYNAVFVTEDVKLKTLRDSLDVEKNVFIDMTTGEVRNTKSESA